MNTCMPGFNADASLYVTSGHYASVQSRGSAGGAVVPQLMGEVGLGDPCGAACRCCKRGNRFCCSHCRWCKGPIGFGMELSLD